MSAGEIMEGRLMEDGIPPCVNSRLRPFWAGKKRTAQQYTQKRKKVIL